MSRAQVWCLFFCGANAMCCWLGSSITAHTCTFCLRAFAIPSNLKRHLKLHAKVDSAGDASVNEVEEGGDDGIQEDDDPYSVGQL